ncbi:hypothetical protein N7492_007430 [Penicillium capsulatum]|uniref:Heterokaryon incompatibility domain-containing protein n=1 Tax=Penicillium capsulatum TaxID=69766 RepID=A0A9W9HZU0_9EURO|nr:hypothetical protein N7492_007430 [Penicillium capsulatum]KAJ6117266.1 hypothetical protein N7512_006991 [Penicillium capsulatum]
MDLLPRPLGSSTPDIDVPLLDIIPYVQHQDFFTFAERHGIESTIDENIGSKQLATIIQSWLFFGLLAEHLGYMPNLSDLTRTQMVDGNLTSYVSLQLLADLPCDEKDSNDEDENDDDLDPHALKFLKMAKFANSWLNDLEKLPCAATSPVPVIALSTRILIESLIALRISASLKSDERIFDPFGRGMNKSQVPSTTIQEAPPSLRLVIDRLYVNGWCPEQAKGLVQNLGYMPLYYMSQIKRHNPQGLDHQKCRDAICTAGVSSDRVPGIPRHRWPKCACTLHSVPIESVLSTLRLGKIPLIRLMDDPSGELIVNVEPLTTRSRYIALSHVWSDGLGNTADNSVYKCQLEQIRSQLANVPVYDEGTASLFSSMYSIDLQRLRFSLGLPNHTSTLFWLDILCIPAKGLTGVNDIELSQLRERAISQIPVVFAGAAQTLVLDSELQSLRLSGSQLPEISARLLGSQWASRAWTFQEGAHALRCRVQLADGAVDPVDNLLWLRTWEGFRFCTRGGVTVGLLKNDYKSHVGSIRTFLEKHLLIAFQNHLLPWFPPKTADKENSSDEQVLIFIRTWNELLLRSTSKVSDLNLILAMALNLPLYRILALPTSQRLRYILWSLDRVPLSLLYIPRPRDSKNTNTLNSWAPENIHGSSLRALYPLAARDYGEFSDAKDLLTFHLRTDDNLVIVPLAGEVPNTPRLRLQTARGKHQIWFHRPSTSVPATSYSLGKLLVIDPRSVAPEGQQCKDPWKAGCSFNVQEARAVGKFEWELRLIYDCAISALEETNEDEKFCGHCRGSNYSESSLPFLFQQDSNDSEDQESWTSPLVTILHLSLPCGT